MIGSNVAMRTAAHQPAPVLRVAGLAETMTQARVALVLAAVMGVAVAARLVAYHGYWGADDGEYALLAHAMARGQFWSFVDAHYVARFDGPAHLPYRMGLIAPLALLFRVFGVSEHVLIAYPLVISVLGVALAFSCARHFFGDRAGLIAAALYALIPIDIKNATQFLPDIVATFYASLGVLVVVRAPTDGRDSSRALFLRGLGAGALFGVSWLTKETVTYLVPLCGLLIVGGLRTNWRRTVPLWMGIAVASGGILTAEMVYYGLVRGDFMLRMHENERSFNQTRSYLFYEGSRFGWPVGGSRARALVSRLFLDGPRAFFLNPQFLFLPLFALCACVRAWYRRDSAFAIPAAWMITLILMFNFASPSFATYTPLVLLERYLVPILLPAAVLTAGLFVRFFDAGTGSNTETARGRILLGGATTAALVLVCAIVGFMEVRDLRRIRPLFDVRQAANHIGPTDVVYADPLTRKALEFYWKYPARTRIVDIEGLDASAVPSGSYVIVDRNRLRWLNVNVSMWLTKDYGYHPPTFASNAPAGWKLVWRNASATLYEVQQ